MIRISMALPGFRGYLQRLEASTNTVSKYIHDVKLLSVMEGDCIETLEQLLHFKQQLQQKGYAARSINSMLSAVNKFVCYCGHPEWKLRFLKVQRVSFADEQREISRAEYQRLVEAADKRGDQRLALIMQTICATGIRVSELHAITVAGIKKGVVEICSKAKIRTILLPKGLWLCWLITAADRGLLQAAFLHPSEAFPWAGATSGGK